MIKPRTLPQFDWFWKPSFLTGGPIWEGGGAPYDYGGRAPTTLIGSTPEWIVGQPGRGLEFNDASRNGETIELTNFDNSQLDLLGTFTYAIHFEYIGTSDSTDPESLGLQWSAMQGGQQVDARRLLVRYDSTAKEIRVLIRDGTASRISEVGVSIEDGLPHVFVTTLNASINRVELWLDGKLIFVDLTNVGVMQDETHTRLSEAFGGHLVTTDGSDSPRVRGYGWAFHNVIWTHGQIRQYSADPYGPYVQPDQMFSFPAIAPSAPLIGKRGTDLIEDKLKKPEPWF